MKRIVVFAFASVSLAALAGCETTGYRAGGVSYSNGYYGDYYGAPRRGYWGHDGYYHHRPYRYGSYYGDRYDYPHHWRRDRPDRPHVDRPKPPKSTPPRNDRPAQERLPNRFNPRAR